MTQNAAVRLQDEFVIRLEWGTFANTTQAKVKCRIKKSVIFIEKLSHYRGV